MNPTPELFGHSTVVELRRRAEELAHRIDTQSRSYAGLKDVDLYLELAQIKLSLSLRLLDEPSLAENPTEARDQALGGVNLLEMLLDENLSLDQSTLIRDHEQYKKARELFQSLLLRGGGAFFDKKIDDLNKRRLLARVITHSVEKYLDADDLYRPVFKTEKLPRWLREVVNRLFYILAPENQQDPPYGIEEGEELEYSARGITIPLSQAIYYIEEELLPELRSLLTDAPGDTGLQRQILGAERKLAGYKQLKYIPRSTPLVPEKGYFDRMMTGYTDEGEMLVTVRLPVRYKSGTNMDRIQELVQNELVRQLAGKGVSPVLDQEYAHLKKLSSGKRGSSRVPSAKLDYRRDFLQLKRLYPVLARLEDKSQFAQLMDLVRAGRRTATRLITAMQNSEHPPELL